MSELVKEIWKPVQYQGVDYTGLYEVSNLGRVAKISKGVRRLIKTDTSKRRSMSLTKNKKQASTSVARVILSSFHGIVFTGTLVADHINNNPCDDRLCNLQAISQRENILKDRKGTSVEDRGIRLAKNSIYKYMLSLNIPVNYTKGMENTTYVYLGTYNTKSEARQVREIFDSTAKKLNGRRDGSALIRMKRQINALRESFGLPKSDFLSAMEWHYYFNRRKKKREKMK